MTYSNDSLMQKLEKLDRASFGNPPAQLLDRESVLRLVHDHLIIEANQPQREAQGEIPIDGTAKLDLTKSVPLKPIPYDPDEQMLAMFAPERSYAALVTAAQDLLLAMNTEMGTGITTAMAKVRAIIETEDSEIEDEKSR